MIFGRTPAAANQLPQVCLNAWKAVPKIQQHPLHESAAGSPLTGKASPYMRDMPHARPDRPAPRVTFVEPSESPFVSFLWALGKVFAMVLVTSVGIGIIRYLFKKKSAQ